MKFALALILVVLSCAFVSAQDSVYNNTLPVGQITKGKMLTKTFTTIPVPVSTFALEAVQVAIFDSNTKARFNHDALTVSAVDLTLGGKKIVSFTASSILNPLVFPSPYALSINGALGLSVSLFTNQVTNASLEVQYFFKYSTSSNFVSLTRTATSAVANYSSFNVPGTGGVYTVSNPITWQQNADSMSFQAAGSQGVISMQIADSSNNIVCKSTAIYKNNVLQSMTPCNKVVSLTKGTTYTTTATYNNTKPIKGVFSNFGFYVGFPRPTTTASTSASSTHTTATGPAATSTGPAATSTGGHSAGSSTTGGHSAGSSAGGSSAGGHSAGGHSAGSSAGGSSAGGSSSEGGSTSSNPTGTSSNPTGTSSEFTTTATGSSSNPTASATTDTAGPTVSPTGYTVGTGQASIPWESQRRIQIY